jgi:hypothetical protein
MHPILASDFGNLTALIFAVPAVGLSVLVGAFGALFRFQMLQVICGIVCFIAGVFLLFSLGTKDDGSTVIAALTALGIGAVLLFLSRIRKM